MTAVESGLGVAVVTARTAQLFRSRARFKILSPGPKPLCIAAGYRTDRGDHQPLAVNGVALKSESTRTMFARKSATMGLA